MSDIKSTLNIPDHHTYYDVMCGSSSGRTGIRERAITGIPCSPPPASDALDVLSRAGKQQQNRDYTHRTSGIHSHNTHRHKVAERWERGQRLEVKKGVHKHSYEAESKQGSYALLCIWIISSHCDNISRVLWGTLNRKDTQETWEVATGSKRKGAVWLWQHLLKQRFELQSPQLVVIVLRRKVNLCAVLRISQHVENITDLWAPCI